MGKFTIRVAVEGTFWLQIFPVCFTCMWSGL